MSNGSPPTTIEGWPRLSTGRIGLVGFNLAAHIYYPVGPTGLLPPIVEDVLENFPVFATNGVAIAPDAGIWVYQPNVPYGMIEVIPSLVPPALVTPPTLTYVTGGGGAGNVGSQYATNAGTWNPSTPTPTYTRQWIRNGSPIAGATAVTYTIASADIGTIINCLVTATNPAGSSTPAPASNPVGPIPDPTPPEEMRAAPRKPTASPAPPKHGRTTGHAGGLHRRSSGSSKR